MASKSIDDRWFIVDKKTGEKRQSDRHGQGKRYRARYRDDAGREPTKAFDLKKDAQAWLDQQTAALVRGDWADPKAGRETLAAYAGRWEQIQVSAEGTARIVDNALRLHVLPALGSQRIASIRRSDVQALVKALEAKEMAPGSIRNIYDVLARVLDSATEDRVIPASPCKRIALPKDHDGEVVPPTLEEIEAVRAKLDERWQVIPVVLAGSGVRAGELLGMELPDWDFLRRTVRLQRQRLQSSKIAPLKSKASRRTLPVGKVTTDALAAHLVHYPASDEALFLDEWGKPLTYQRWKKLLRAAAVTAGVDLTSHSFRHFAASALISGGASVKQVQVFLGHSSAVITLRTYAHLFPGDEDRTRDVLDAALSPLSFADSLRTEGASK